MRATTRGGSIGQAKTLSPEKITASHYIVNFGNEVNMITRGYAEYVNVILEAESRMGITGPEKVKEMFEKNRISEEDAKNIVLASKGLSMLIIQTYIHYLTIVPQLKGAGEDHTEEAEKAKILFEHITRQSLVSSKDVLDFVMLMNLFIGGNAVRSLMENSSDIINQLYGVPDAQQGQEGYDHQPGND